MRVMLWRYKNFEDIVRRRLCVGCGACVPICPRQRITLVDVTHEGLRPFPLGTNCQSCGDCVRVCPGLNSSISLPDPNQDDECVMKNGPFGRYLALWEGYASDPKIRINGASGGITTALACFAIEQLAMEGVVHVKSDPLTPCRNMTVYSRTRKEVISATGSRYAPASPCEGFEFLSGNRNRSVFIGKPCDISGLRRAINIQPDLAEKVGLALGFFCAGTPATDGTLKLLEREGMDLDNLAEVRYRGRGWPGDFCTRTNGSEGREISLNYEASWGFLQSYRPFRCHLCPDGTAEMADLSLGDAWYKKPEDQSPGISLIIVRTRKGKKFLRQAMAAGSLTAIPVEEGHVLQSQVNLMNKRRAVWGRLFALRSLGLPAPNYRGYSLFRHWKKLSMREKNHSVLGAYKRILIRRLFMPFKPTTHI